MKSLKLKPSKFAGCMQATKVRTPKYKFHVEIGGKKNKPTILLIMGVGAQHLAWPTEFCQTLIDGGYRVIRFDNRDIGKSTKMKHKNAETKHFSQPIRRFWLAIRFQIGLSNHKIPLPYNLFDMAEDVRQLLIALNITRCHVIGMSMGGMIAQILAAEHADLIGKLGLIATSNNRPFSRPPNPKNMIRTLPPKKTKDAEASIEYIYKTLKTVSSKNYFDEASARNKAKMIYQRRFYPIGTHRHLLAILATGSLKKLNARITQPTLVIHGKQDKIIPISHGQSVAKNISGAELISIPNMGHEIPIAISEKIAQHFIKHFSNSGFEKSKTTKKPVG